MATEVIDDVTCRVGFDSPAATKIVELVKAALSDPDEL
jgi:hypothetical protein